MRRPINDPNTDEHYFDVALASGKSFDWQPDHDMQAFVYMFEGGLTVLEIKSNVGQYCLNCGFD